VLMSRDQDGTFYIEDVRRGRWRPAERDNRILRTAKLDGYNVQIVLEQEPGSAGKSVTDYLGRRLAGHMITADRPTGSKEVRAQPLAGQCGIGNVCLVQGEWNAAYLDELCIFPNGRYDDQVDASSGAFARLTRFGLAFTPPTALRIPPRERRLFGAPFDHAAARAVRSRHRQTDRS
jgi:predicted phage terminase large subunit-like protein